ncbi:MAG: hypothetical protein MR659_07555 [Mollicutes bacterium]|nr:hypothetical protein [Mollicutes bacterium]MDY3903922.1 hypothetical protein [Candidatus Enteromonas sp.]
MDTIFDLIHRQNDLPKGNIYKKVIKNNTYFYHQYRENGKNYSIKLNNDEVAPLKEQIEERKVIEKNIKALLKNGNREIELSTFAKEYTGYVMSGNIVVAEFNKGVLVPPTHKLCPLVIKRTNSIYEFLKSRSIDSGRTNSRLLRKVLNINVKDDTLVSLCSYAASISDNYWFKPKHSKLKYEDISFNNDIFFDTALKGIITIYPKKLILTPELTTNGSYEKGWRNIDGNWWLYKVGTINERYSEVFYSRLFEKLILPTAHYEIDGNYIRTANFAKGVNFEPMVSLVGDNEDIEYIYDALNKINHQIALDYLRLITFDVVLNNVDRHNENCGILRDKETGEIISLAPNYDDNLSLISRNTTLIATEQEGFLSLFLKTIRKSKKIKEGLKEIEFPIITSNLLRSIHEEIGLEIEVDFEAIERYIMFRYETVIKAINK